MKYFNFYYEDFKKKELNLTDKIILSVISSVGDYSLNYNELSHFTSVSIQNVKVSLKKLKKDNLIQGEKILTVTEKPIGKYFKVQIDSDLSVKENMILSFIKSTLNKAYFGSLQTLSNVLTLAVSTVIIGLNSLIEKDRIRKDKYNKCYKYSIIDIPSDEVEEEVVEEPIENEEVKLLKIKKQIKAELEKINNRLSNATIEYKKLRDNYNDLVFRYQELQKENERLKQQQIKNNPKPQPTKTNAPYNITKGMVDLIKNLIINIVLKYCNHNEKYNNSAYQDLYNYLNTVQVDESLKNEEFNNDCYTYREDIAKQEGLKYEVQFAGELVKRSLKQIVDNKGRCQQQEIITRLEAYYKKIDNKYFK